MATFQQRKQISKAKFGGPEAEVAYEPTIAGDTEAGISDLVPRGRAGTAAASTRLTPTVVYGSSSSSDEDDKLTHVSDASSRLSASRPSNQLGPSRRKRKQERTASRMKAKKEALGQTFQDAETFYRSQSVHSASSQGVFSDKAPAVEIRGSVALALSTREFTNYVVKRGAELEEKHFSMSRMCQSLPDTTLTEGELYDATNKRVLAYDVCVLCGKVNASTHSSGKDHVKLVGVQAEISRLLGMPARGFREHSVGYISPAPTISLSAFAEWWGRDEKSVVELFPLMVREKLNRSGVRIKYSDNRPSCLLEPDEVEAVVPAVVNYKAHTGKYETTSNKITFMHEVDGMPTNKDTEWWPVALIKPKQDFHVRERAVPDGDDDPRKKSCFPDTVEMSELPDVLAKGLPIPMTYASCIYQLAETAAPPVAWKIGVRVRERT